MVYKHFIPCKCEFTTKEFKLNSKRIYLYERTSKLIQIYKKIVFNGFCKYPPMIEFIFVLFLSYLICVLLDKREILNFYICTCR